MAAASRSLATALWESALTSGLLQPSYTTKRDTTAGDDERTLVIAPQERHKYELSLAIEDVINHTRTEARAVERACTRPCSTSSTASPFASMTEALQCS